eukprot:scaffold7126_cov506-Pinguiococcus_pyrenoidosus.AAC.1
MRKWYEISREVAKFLAAYKRLKQANLSGWNEEMYVDEARKRYEAEEGTTFAFLPVFEIAKAKKKFHVFCDKKPSRASLPKGTKKAKQEAQEADACSQA